MATARTIHKKAMQKIGVLTKSETPDADEASDGLDSLNTLLESWSNESLLAYVRLNETFNLSGGTASYTIGSGATFNTSRPLQVVSGFVTVGSTDYPLTKIKDTEYDAIPDKSTSGIPDRFFYDYNSPTGTITLYPTPSSAYTITLRMEKSLTSISTLDTSITFPPGWERALIYNLAVEIAPEYGAVVDQITYDTALKSKGVIASSVAKNRTMDTAPLVNTGTFNILTGQYS